LIIIILLVVEFKIKIIIYCCIGIHNILNHIVKFKQTGMIKATM